MMGVAATGNNFGGLVMPALIAGLLATMAWSETSVVIGAATLVVAVAAALMVREAPPASNTPLGGLRPTVEHAPPHGTSLRDRDLPDIVRSRMFRAMFVAVTFGMFTYSAVLPHVLPHLLNRGMSNATAVSIFGTFAVGGACGKLLFGWMSERYGARRMLLSNLIGQAVFSALLAVGGDKAVLAVATPMFGLFMGGFGTLYVLLIQEQFGLRHFGSIAGPRQPGLGPAARPRPPRCRRFVRPDRQLRCRLSRHERSVRRRRRVAHLRSSSCRPRRRETTAIDTRRNPRQRASCPRNRGRDALDPGVATNGTYTRERAGA